jgi:ubiquinone biosynthesis protein Coq4
MKTIKKIRSQFLEFVTHKIALPLIGKFRTKPQFPYSMDQLLQMPDDTLGKELANYLQKMNFKLLPNYEQHDCKHIILQYEMDEVGEARMQFYFLGNRHYSLPVISTTLLCFLLMLEHWKQFWRDYKKGRTTKTFDNVDFSSIILMNTTDLRIQYLNQ